MLKVVSSAEHYVTMIAIQLHKRRVSLCFLAVVVVIIIVYREREGETPPAQVVWHSPAEPKSFVNTNHPLPQLVFVTASGWREFADSQLAVHSIKSRFADHLLLYYDRGLSSRQVRLVKSWCGVTYRRFDYSPYTSSEQHGHLVPSSWSMLFLAECLFEYHVCMWLEPSVVITSPPAFVLDMYPKLAKTWVLLSESTNYSIARLTDQSMIYYLPSKKLFAIMYTSRIVTMALTKAVYTDVLMPLIKCIQNEKCIGKHSGFHSLTACRSGKEYTGVGACHSFETSALNILVRNLQTTPASLYFALDFTSARKVLNRTVTIDTCTKEKSVHRNDKFLKDYNANMEKVPGN